MFKLSVSLLYLLPNTKKYEMFMKEIKQKLESFMKV